MINSRQLSTQVVSAAPNRGKLSGRTRRELFVFLVIAVLHIPLGIVLYSSPSLGIMHPIAVFLVGIYWAVQTRFGLDKVALAAGYIVGAEVLWRMAQVPIYWEFGKYGIVAMMVIALVVRRRVNVPPLPLFYGLLLIPGCIISFMVFDISEARGFISADMSGPLALFVSCWFFSQTQLNARQLQRLTYIILIPLISVAFVSLFYTVSVEEIQFTTESNLATSGGFGPNQVSSMLGLGVFVAAGCIILFKNSPLLKVGLGILALFFAAQSIMTFSRGGIYNALGALAVLTIFHFRHLGDGLRRVVPIVFLVAVFAWFIFPVLNNFTGGKLEERFSESSTTNRMEIIWSDLEIFLENPVFGVGVSVSRSYRERFLPFSSTSHTEFARLISEHGLFGLAAILALAAMTVKNLKRRRSLLQRALIAGLAIWCFLYMSNAGMRLAAPSFLFGLTFVTILEPRLRRRRLIRQTDAGSSQNSLDIRGGVTQSEL